MSNDENILMLDSNVPEMLAANEKARKTFGYFWRELSWDYRRIVSALDVAFVKIAFYDREAKAVEHMWINEVEFDGKYVTGFIINSPIWLTNISVGDFVKVALSDVSDWMFGTSNKVYGGFTVNLLRSRMSAKEMKSHDQAWGLNFGDPNCIDLVRVNSYTDEANALVEHHMSINMGESLVEALNESDELVKSTDEDGWTMLHREALAGNATMVEILLDHGADKKSKNKYGLTPLELAKIFNWKKVIELLSK